jgi:hypothetical protein
MKMEGVSGKFPRSPRCWERARCRLPFALGSLRALWVGSPEFRARGVAGPLETSDLYVVPPRSCLALSLSSAFKELPSFVPI